MSDNDIYSPPSAELEDETTPPRIGGWLRFFQVINWLGLILCVLAVVILFGAEMLAGGMFELPFDGPAIFLELLAPIIITFLIIKALPDSSAETPNKIKKLLGYYLACSMVVGIAIYLAYNAGHVSEKPAPILGDLVYYAIWASYFKKSKRVNEYYGANAD